MKLPFVDNLSILGDSRQIALDRFLTLKRRLAKNTTVKAQYVKFIKEYASLDHMSRIDPNSTLLHA